MDLCQPLHERIERAACDGNVHFDVKYVKFDVKSMNSGL